LRCQVKTIHPHRAVEPLGTSFDRRHHLSPASSHVSRSCSAVAVPIEATPALTSMAASTSWWVFMMGIPAAAKGVGLRLDLPTSMALRMDSSSSMMEIKGPAGTRRPFSRLTAVMRAEHLRRPLCTCPDLWESYPGVIPELSMGFWLQRVGHADQIGERSGSHFAHGCSAMNFYRYLAKAQFASHLLIHLTGRHEHHNLLLTRR